MIETSQQPLTRRGKSKGKETYGVFIESPARWGYVKSKKTKYQRMKAKLQQIKVKYQQIKAKYQQLNVKYEHNIHVKYMSEQIYAKHLQRFYSITSLNDQHGKSSTQFTDQELLLKILTNNAVSSHTSNADKMTCRLSRVRLCLQVGTI